MNEIIINDNKLKLEKEARPFNPVRLEPIVFANKQTGNHVVIELDDGREAAVSQVGTSYTLFSNEIADHVATEILSQSGMEWNMQKTFWTGKRYVQTYISEETAIEIPKVNDVIKYGFRIENSYDGSSRLRAAVMAYVLSCTNGMVSDRLFGAFSIKHNNDVHDVDIADAIGRLQDGTKNLVKYASHFNDLTTRPFTWGKLKHIAQDQRISPSFIGKFVTEMPVSTDNVSEWDALQCGTELLRDSNKISDIRTVEGWTESFIAA